MTGADLHPDLSGPFTRTGGEGADAVVMDHVRRITSEILSLCPETLALILAGGFGRGEGVIAPDGSAVNDYDFALVTENRLMDRRLKDIMKQAASVVMVRNVDIINIPVSMIPSLPPTIFNYDLAHGSKLCAGAPGVLASISRHDAGDIPVVEAEILLFNRLICLSECFPSGFPTRRISAGEEFFLFTQLSKCVMAMCDTLLVRNGLYHHLYHMRMQQAMGCADIEKAGGTRLSEWAYSFKLSGAGAPPAPVPDIWFQVRSLYIPFLLETIAQRTGRAPVLHDIESFLVNDFRPCWKRIADRFMKKNIQYRPKIDKIRINAAQILLLSAINSDGTANEQILKKAELSMKTVSGRIPEGDWEQAMKSCVRWWKIAIHDGVTDEKGRSISID